MAKRENPPFARGTTWYDGSSIDTTNYGGINLEGTIWEFEDTSPLEFPANTGGARTSRTGRPVRCMIVRNVSGITLLPKRLVTLQTAGTDGKFLIGRVDGYVTTDGQEGYPVDEYLPSTGVVNGDLFWVVIDGPALVITDLAGGVNNSINVGDVLTGLTAATSQATTAGRVKKQVLTGATAPLAVEVMNRIGRALSAKTTAQTNNDILVDVRKW
jgi:hypothetical protein